MKKSFISITLFIIAIFTKILYLTLRVKSDNLTKLALSKKSSSAVFCWHGSLGMLPYVNVYFRRTPIVGLVSNSRDGSYLAYFLSRFKINSERGSSNKNGGRAAINLIRILRSGGNICITPDGPKGPASKIKQGMLSILDKTPESRLIFLRIEPHNAWTFKSWDKFYIPKPFSKVSISALEFRNFEAFKAAADAEGISYSDSCESLLG